MRKYNLVIITLILNFGLSFAKVTIDVSGSLKKLNLPNIENQLNIIEADKHHYGDNDLTYLQGRSIRACISWLQEWNDNVEVELFSFMPKALIVKTWHEIPIDKQKDEIARQELEFYEYPFSVYPEYQNCNIEDLLSSGKVLMAVKISMPNPGNIVIGVKALVNKVNSKRLEDFSVNKTNVEFYLIEFSYSYDLRIISTDETQESIDKAVQGFEFDLEFHYSEYYQELLKHPKGKYNNHSRLFKNFRWQISEIALYKIRNICLSNDNIPLNLSELFQN